MTKNESDDNWPYEIPLNAKNLIEILKLEPLDQEGGFFRETMRSTKFAIFGNKRLERYTTIYYMLLPGTISLPHTLKSDEIWHFYFGDPVRLCIFEEYGTLDDIILGDEIGKGQRPQALVPAGKIQGAYRIENKHGFSLMATNVIPAFRFEDFTLVELSKLLEIVDEIPAPFVKPDERL